METTQVLSTDEWIKKKYIHTMELLFSLKKEGNPVTCYNVDEPGRHFGN